MQYTSTFIRSLYSPGFASMMTWFFNTNLTIGFTPWTQKNYSGFDQYDKNKFISTSIDYEKASTLYLLAKNVIDGKIAGQFQHQIECNKQATLTFELKPDQSGEMRSYLTLSKNGEQIQFLFSVQKCCITGSDGKREIQVLHTGLGVFAMTLEGYLSAVGASNHLGKLTDAELGDPQAVMSN